MNGWIDRITDLVNRAAKDASLPEVRGMFEGDSWLWTWRTWGEQVTETLVRVRPDVFGDGFEMAVSAGAWIPTRRDIAAGRTYYTRYLELKTLPDQESTFLAELTKALIDARHGADNMAPRLGEIEKARSELLNKLHALNLLK
jgi:hypothetical protein